MKKASFLTLIHKNGSDVAEYVNGYTDHAYNYYKDKYGRWYAILPDNGMAICVAYRLKDARQSADAQFTRIVNQYPPEHFETARERFLKAARIAVAIDE